MKKILSVIFISLLLPSFALANFGAIWQGTSTPQQWIFPAPINGNFPAIQVPYVIATSTTATSVFNGFLSSRDLEGLTGIDFNILSGSVAPGNTGTQLIFTAGNGNGAADGGNLNFNAGDAGTSGMGGLVQLFGGRGKGAGNLSGNVIIQAGPALSGASVGYVLLNKGNIGIGATTTPGTLLSVQGIANFDTSTSTLYSGLIVNAGGLLVNTLKSCSGSSALNTDATGLINCGAISFPVAGTVDPFAHTLNFGTTTSATGTPMWFRNGLFASSTGLTFLDAATTTNATSTTLFATMSKSVNDYVSSSSIGKLVTGNVTSTSTLNCTNGLTTDAAGKVVCNGSAFLSSVTADSPLAGSGTSASHLTCTTCVTGSGSASDVTYWTSGSAVSGDGNFTWDSANQSLAIHGLDSVSDVIINGSGDGGFLTRGYVKGVNRTSGRTVFLLSDDGSGAYGLLSMGGSSVAGSGRSGEFDFFDTDIVGADKRSGVISQDKDASGDGGHAFNFETTDSGHGFHTGIYQDGNGNVGFGGNQTPLYSVDAIGSGAIVGSFTNSGTNIAVEAVSGVSTVDLANGGIAFSATDGTRTVRLADGTYAVNATGNETISGTSNIGSTLTVTGNGIFNSKVGIGTSTPYELLSVAGNIVVQHITSTSTLPTLSICGTGASVQGSDTAGIIYTGRSSSGCRLTFAKTFSVAPYCVVSPASTTGTFAATSTTSTLNVMATSTSVGGATLGVTYICIQGN